MLFRDVALEVRTLEYDGTYESDFCFRSRYVCNYLVRVVRLLRRHVDGFRGICVEGSSEAERHCRVEGADMLVVGVEFDPAHYDALSDEDRHEFFLSMLKEGLDVGIREFDFPYDELLEGMDAFRAGGYRNEWTHKKRLFRGMGGLRGFLNCKLDSERFALRLRLERKGQLLYDEEIYESKPGELCYYYDFKDMVIDGDSLIVTRRFESKECLFKLNLGSVLNEQMNRVCVYVREGRRCGDRVSFGCLRGASTQRRCWLPRPQMPWELALCATRG